MKRGFGTSRRERSATSKNRSAAPTRAPSSRWPPASGKTFTAVNVAYRLLKFAGAKRILFLVDRGNLGKQTEDEFAATSHRPTTPKVPDALHRPAPQDEHDQSRRPRSSSPPSSASIRCSRARPSSTPENEEASAFDTAKPCKRAATDVVYNAGIPPEFFDFIIVDECHRSIYKLWRQVLRLLRRLPVGLTATPAGKTIGFFNQNLVMQYGHDEAVADGVNVDFDVYRIRTRITEQGATIAAGETGVYVDKRHQTHARASGWELLDQDLTYTANAARPRRRGRKTRSAPSSARSATRCCPTPSPAAPKCPRR